MAKKNRPVPLTKGITATSIAKKQALANKGSGRKRKRTKTKPTPSNDDIFSSTAESLAVISEYHTLNKRLEQIESDVTLNKDERQRAIQAVHKQQEALGGLDRYQKASMYGAKSSKFVCADWVIPLLKANEKNIKSNQKGRLRILDVGAIDNQYFQYENWLQAVPIDLHGGQHESVLQVDFFDYAHSYCSGTDLYETKNKDNTATANKSPEPFDAIVMSLVLNFQGDPRKRGDMLALACDPRLLKADRSGMLFVALPSASLDNSRYCDLERFVEVCTNPLFGLELVEQKHSAKLILLAFRKTNFDTSSHAACYNASKKTFHYGGNEMKRLQPAKPGAKRNNFAVILKSSHNRTTTTTT